MQKVFVKEAQYQDCLESLEYQTSLRRGRVVALAGPRGIGKTRLLEEFQKLTKERGFFAYLLPCPKTYEAREFAISLYKEVIRKHVPTEIPVGSGLILWSWEARFLALLTISAVFAVSLLFYVLGSLGIAPWTSWHDVLTSDYVLGIVVPIVVGLLMIGVVILLRARHKLGQISYGGSAGPSSLSLIRGSLSRLKRVDYNEKITVHGGANLRGFSFSKSSELSLRPYTQRELVDDFKQYIDVLSKHYPGIVICIDELDKITDTKSLKEFLTETKDLLYMPDTPCVFVVSISEDAVGKYLTGVKDVVDSTFDEIYILEAASFETSTQLAKQSLNDGLQRTGAPEIIACSIGGIPRQIERAAHLLNRSGLTIQAGDGQLFTEITKYEVNDTIHGCRTLRAEIMSLEDQKSTALAVKSEIDKRLRLLLRARALIREKANWDGAVRPVMDELFQMAAVDRTGEPELTELNLRIAQCVLTSRAISLKPELRQELHAIMNEIHGNRAVPQDMVDRVFG